MAKDNSNSALTFSPAEHAILTTILYSDIFSFPLTEEELWQWLISEKKISKMAFDTAMGKLKDQLVCKKGYYCLKGREKIIDQRIKNLSEVVKKKKIAHYAAQKLSGIPTILYIGISGGLAAGNVTSSDDIDFVIIVKKNTLFVTRLFILGILQGLGIRRTRNQKNTADTICVNLLFDESELSWFAKKQDLYTARELSQLIPIFERGTLSQRFYEANKWIYQFFPNLKTSTSVVSEKERIVTSRFIFNSFTEAICRSIQMSIMKRHHTRELLTKHFLAFHPFDYKTKTLNELRLKMRQFGLLTNF